MPHMRPGRRDRLPTRHIRPLDLESLLAEARKAADRDAKAGYPDAEIGQTPPPFENEVESRARIRAFEIEAGYEHVLAPVARRDAVAARRSQQREDAAAAARGRLAQAEADLAAAKHEAEAGPEGWRRRLAHLGGTAAARFAVLGAIIFGEAVALKPTLDILGESYWVTYLLVCVIVGASLIIATLIAHKIKEAHLAEAAGQPGPPPPGGGPAPPMPPRGILRRLRALMRRTAWAAGWAARRLWQTTRTGLIRTGLVLLVFLNLFVATVRAATFVAQAQVLVNQGVPVSMNGATAFGLFLALQFALTFAAGGYEYLVHDPLVAPVRRAVRNRRHLALRCRLAHRRLTGAGADARHARERLNGLKASFGALTQGDLARFALVRDTYRSHFAATCQDVYRAAAVSDMPRSPYPVPAREPFPFRRPDPYPYPYPPFTSPSSPPSPPATGPAPSSNGQSPPGGGSGGSSSSSSSPDPAPDPTGPPPP
jgi:hypothetical protein